MKKIVLLLFLSCLKGILSGQYVNNPLINTPVSTSSQSANGELAAVQTVSGKTYIAYLDGSFYLQVQQLDNYGNKTFGTTGITLDYGSPSYVIVNTTSMITDNNENAIIAFSNWQSGLVKLFVLSPNGTILASQSVGLGSSPKLALLPNNDFVLAYTMDDSSRVQRISYAAGNLTTVWDNNLPYHAESLQALENGNFYMVSYEWTPMVAGYAYSYANLVNGSTGNGVWNNWKMVSSYQHSSIFTSPVSCTIDPQNNLYVTNTYFDIAAGRRAYSQKIDTDGNVLWGTNGVGLVVDGSLDYQERVYTSFATDGTGLQCLINGGGQVVLQSVQSGGAVNLGPSGLILVESNEQAQLFGFQRCDNDLVFSYISGFNNSIKAGKVNTLGNFLWPSLLKSVTTSTGAKSWINSKFLNVQNDVLLFLFQDTRNGLSGLYAQKLNCLGEYPNSLGENKKANALKLYPNVAADFSSIHYTFSEEIKSVRIYIHSALGQMVHTEELNTNTGKIRGPSSRLPDGYYFVKVVADGKYVSTERCVIQK